MTTDDTPKMTIGQIDIDPKKNSRKPDYSRLPVLPTKDFVLFPGVTFPVQLTREQSVDLCSRASESGEPIAVICQKEADIETPRIDDLCEIGVIADVIKVIELPGAPPTAILHAHNRIRLTGPAGATAAEGAAMYITAEPLRDTRATGAKKQLLATIASQVKEKFSEIIKFAGARGGADIGINITDATDAVLIINLVCAFLPMSIDERYHLLTVNHIVERGMELLCRLEEHEQKLEIAKAIAERTHDSINDQQREAFMRQQYETLRKELFGEDDPDEDINRLRAKADSMTIPADVMTVFDRELGKLKRLAPQSPDYAVLLSYLELLLDLPWGKYDAENTDISHASDILEADHFGLEKVKQRILEQIALMINAPAAHSPIICLVGAPGVGKTSLGQSIASATGRKYRRVALGGIHDEAEIRGHRRTYIGAMPGRIIDALRRAGSANPVILLDEIDKVGNDYKGDPGAALLEVLDPEQNCHFHDNYVDVDFDLSKVLFIATANTLNGIPGPLVDRMEVIDISGYIPEEKTEIAKRHLLPRILRESGLTPEELSLPDETIAAVIEQYTGESGVRQLDKRLASIARKAVLAKVSGKEWNHTPAPSDLAGILGAPPFQADRCAAADCPGVVTGLAWTAAGGCTLCVETSLSDAKDSRLTLTGNLGDVMKESAAIALQHVRANAGGLGIAPGAFEGKCVHIHVPEGAIPKDGPSAGITMATSIVSAFTGRKAKPHTAMTGELTLSGKVLPIGGVREKILAAKRAGVTTVLLPEANRKDVGEIPPRYLEGLDIIYVGNIADVFDAALE